MSTKPIPGQPAYYEIRVMVEIPAEEHSTWDSGCDEVHGVWLASKPDWHLVDYKLTTRDEFEQNRYNIFDENGGL